ncbi:unnamed protein product [Scytosiphon promiscuus]
MLCCLVCLKGTPVPGSKLSAFYTNTDQFQIGVMESCWKNCPWCVFGYVCACCAQFIVRQRALDGNLDNYRCCQGHCRQCTDQGCCGVRKYPRLCLCLESFACICCAMKSNRMHLMDKFKLQPDPWDNRVIVSRLSARKPTPSSQFALKYRAWSCLSGSSFAFPSLSSRLSPSSRAACVYTHVGNGKGVASFRIMSELLGGNLFRYENEGAPHLVQAQEERPELWKRVAFAWPQLFPSDPVLFVAAGVSFAGPRRLNMHPQKYALHHPKNNLSHSALVWVLSPGADTRANQESNPQVGAFM